MYPWESTPGKMFGAEGYDLRILPLSIAQTLLLSAVLGGVLSMDDETMHSTLSCSPNLFPKRKEPADPTGSLRF